MKATILMIAAVLVLKSITAQAAVSVAPRAPVMAPRAPVVIPRAPAMAPAVRPAPAAPAPRVAPSPFPWWMFWHSHSECRNEKKDCKQ